MGKLVQAQRSMGSPEPLPRGLLQPFPTSGIAPMPAASRPQLILGLGLGISLRERSEPCGIWENSLLLWGKMWRGSFRAAGIPWTREEERTELRGKSSAEGLGGIGSLIGTTGASPRVGCASMATGMAGPGRDAGTQAPSPFPQAAGM